MITEIGIVAGEIWHFLDESKEATLTKINETIGRDREIALMSLGWLAREGHVILSKDKQDYHVKLRF